MIGQAKFDFYTKDIIQLIKKELVDKLGNRELASYDMSVPGVFTPQARISVYPNPETKEVTVQEQINQMGLPKKPDIPRSSNSVTLDTTLGGEEILFSFDREKNLFTIYGGPVSWTPAGESGRPKGGHWVGVKVGFPLGITPSEGQVIPYTYNNEPRYTVISEENITDGFITFIFDAANTTNNLSINWSNDYNPELLYITITASLEDTAVKKIPALPTSSKFEFKFPAIDTFTEADVLVHVDLEVGK